MKKELGPLYVSTRGGVAPKTFTSILLEGAAPDGGLYVPDYCPRFTDGELAKLRGLSYQELAIAIISRLTRVPDYEVLAATVRKAYTKEAFGTAEITPLVPLKDGVSLLRLSNGPTNAFKDIGLQLLGELFEYELAIMGDDDSRIFTILGATSGDTGSAAIHAMKGRRGIRVFMLSPKGRMSAYQRAQMYSVEDENIFNLVIDGTFDDCQDIVKKVNRDVDFKNRHQIGAVNSINWARIAAQIVYYFAGYFAATKNDVEKVSFSIPSGNFGNAYAAHYARMMGLPIRNIIVATNENDALEVFFRTGHYKVRESQDVVATSSPSMDISNASNFERYIFDLVGRNAARTKRLWEYLRQRGEFVLDVGTFERVAFTGIVSDSSSHQDRLQVIRDVYKECGIMIDPHTADGVGVGLRYHKREEPLICLETALPIKFEDTMREALGDKALFPGTAGLEALPQRTYALPADADQVKAFISSNS